LLLKLFTKINFLLDVHQNQNQNYFIEKLFTETNFTSDLNCLILGLIFLGLGQLLVPLFLIFSFEVFKPLFLCGLDKKIFYEVKSLFPTIPFIFKILCLVVFHCVLS